MTYVVERPAARWIKRWYEKRRKKEDETVRKA